jgi:deoxyguanosine kinase
MTSGGLARYRHIAIEGAIGAGKTTLARELAGRVGAELMLEQPAENPFLGRFYADMKGYAFQTQLFFLFQRQRQVQAIAQPTMFASMVVSDFMLAKDTIFAKLTLSDDEYRLYTQMYAPIAAQLPEPDVVVWLQASPQTLLQRVRRRGVTMEERIDLAYLASLADAYAEYFSSSIGVPVLAVDSERFNPVERPGDLDDLVDQLERFDGPRGFLVADRQTSFG